MKRIIIFTLAACIIAASTSCGNSTNLKDLPNFSQNSSSETEIEIDNSDGYISEMTAAAGLEMENASVDDIIAKFGQPSETQTESRSDTECTLLTYSFGTLYFEDRSGQQILSFAIITDKLPNGIYGINIGDDIYSAAEALYAGSSEQIKETLKLAETAQEDHALFYGSSQDDKYIPPYGLFKVMDIEQSDDSSRYMLEYAVPSTVGSYSHKIEFIFGRDMNLTSIMIDCSEIF